MARGWKCPRCSTENGEGILNCAKCGLIRGGVYVPSAYVPPESIDAPPPIPAADAPPWPAVESHPAPADETHPAPVAELSSLPAAALGVGAPLHLGSSEEQPSIAWVPPYPVAPPPSRPLWRRIPLGLLVFGVLVVGGAVAGFITNASRSSGGDITKGGDLTSNDLRVGDCWDMKDPTADAVDNVAAKPCGEAHEYEVFYIASMAEGTYPTEEAFTSYVESTCIPAFGNYVGKGYHDSALDISWLYPGSDGWAAGDRTIECSAYDPNDNQLTASLRSSGR